MNFIFLRKLCLEIAEIAHGCSERRALPRFSDGFAADPGYWKGEVFAYVGSIQNLKDLKDS